jgi:acetyltransferase-like isoleucine patch superfamily enzyme
MRRQSAPLTDAGDGSVASLSVVVPAYNESAAVAETVANIRRTLISHGVSYALILVDDGSTDETPSRLARLAGEDATNTRVLTHPRNLGLGRAITSGYSVANSEWVSWLPADGQFSAEDLYALYTARTGKDAVIGRVKSSTREQADNRLRVVVSWVSRLVMRLLHPHMPHFNGIMVVRRNRVPVDHLLCSTGFVNMEILDRIRRTSKDFSIGECEVNVFPRRSGRSKVANLRTALTVVYDLCALRIDYLLRPVSAQSRYQEGVVPMNKQAKSTAATESNAVALREELRDMWRALQRQIKSRWERSLPLADCVVDRWERASMLGFGKGASIYDSALVIGDVKVGEHTWIGPGVVLDGSGGLVIGDYCSISAGVQVYTHDTIRWALSGGAEGATRAATRIGSRCYVGPQTVIGKGVSIGDGCIIGAHSLVLQDVPAGMKAVGSPSRVIGPATLEAEH